MEIPLDQLSPEALDGIVTEFVTREGTEYGAEDVVLSAKKKQVLAQLRAGEAFICFDPKTETCDVRPRR